MIGDSTSRLAASVGTAGVPQPSASSDPRRVDRPTDVSGRGPRSNRYDVVIVGSGMGGGTLAYALKDSGPGCCWSNAGTSCRRSRRTGNPRRFSARGDTRTPRSGTTRTASPSAPGRTTTSVETPSSTERRWFGSAVRISSPPSHRTGHRPPGVDYEDLAPYYRRAEQVYRVHGDHLDDPTLAVPNRSRSLPSSTSRPCRPSPTKCEGRDDSVTHPPGYRPAPRRSLHPVQDLRRIPLPVAGEGGHRRLLRAAGRRDRHRRIAHQRLRRTGADR